MSRLEEGQTVTEPRIDSSDRRSGIQSPKTQKWCNICGNVAAIGPANPLCFIPSNVRRFQHEQFPVWRCLRCQSIHLDVVVDLDRYYEHYPLKSHTLNFANWAGYHNRLRILKQQGLRKNHAILEYGCGAGVFLKFLKARGYQCAGYDKFVATYSDESVLRRRYDAVLAYDVIEHDPSPISFLKRLAGLLAEGGLLVIATPNTAEISLEDSTNPHLHQPYHLHMLSEQALTRLGADEGFAATRTYRRWYYDTFWPFVNGRFIETYIRENGNVIDVAVEKPNFGKVMSSPSLLFFGLFGYFLRARGHMTVCFRRSMA